MDTSSPAAVVPTDLQLRRVLWAYVWLYVAFGIIPQMQTEREVHELLHPTTDSDNIAALGVKVGIATMLLVAVQIWIAFRQTALQKRELAIVETQNALMNRRESLSLESPMISYAWSGGAELYNLSLVLHNIGNGVRGLYVNIFLEVPEYEGPFLEVRAPDWIHGDSEFFFVPQRQSFTLTKYTKWFDVLVPGDGAKTTLPSMPLVLTSEGRYVIRWTLQSTSGTAPPDGERGIIELIVFDKPAQIP